MRIILLLFVFLGASLALNAQIDLTLSGKVREHGNGNAIGFANVAIEGQGVGTVANMSGEYEFHFSKAYLFDTLIVSAIGYHNYRVAMQDVDTDEPLNISLKPRSYMLDELVIKPEELKARDILETAIDRIVVNYPQQPYAMEGFYREYFRENGTYVGLAEASVDIFDEMAYQKKPLKDQEIIRINQIRVSDIYNKGNYVLYIALQDALKGNLLRQFEFWDRYFKRGKITDAVLDTISYYEDVPVYCVRFNMENGRKGNVSGKAYIRMDDHAIIQLETLTESPNNRFRLALGNKKKTKSEEQRSVIKYKKYGDRYYLSYINSNSDVEYKIRKEGDYDLTFSAELIVNGIKDQIVEAPKKDDKLLEGSIFYLPRYKTYDPEFWEDYNLFASSSQNDSIIADLEKKRPLNIQFGANGKTKPQLAAQSEIIQIEKVFLLEKIMDQLNRGQKFNGSIIVAEDREILLEKHYGMADFNRKTPIQKESVFNIGEVGQQFTAMAIMQLIDKGALAYDMPVKRILSGFRYRNITIKHLLTHTSGLSNYHDWNSWDWPSKTNKGILTHLKDFQPDLKFNPGRKYEYSPTNYVLLALIVEQISKSSFEEYLNTQILQPLNMNSTFLGTTQGVHHTQPALHYQAKKKRRGYTIRQHQATQIYGDGNIYSSASDLFKWDQSFYDHQLLEEGAFIEAFRPAKLVSGEQANYGFGWLLKREDGRRIQYQVGTTGQHESLILRDASLKNTIILLDNTGNPFLKDIRLLINDILYVDSTKSPEKAGLTH